MERGYLVVHPHPFIFEEPLDPTPSGHQPPPERLSLLVVGNQGLDLRGDHLERLDITRIPLHTAEHLGIVALQVHFDLAEARAADVDEQLLELLLLDPGEAQQVAKEEPEAVEAS